MSIPIFQVDAFTDTPFSGNPAAICVLQTAADDSWMQQVAREMNLSETAFLLPEGDGFRLRWFTPEAEVDLCGHATLASAHTLWESGILPPSQQAKFYTRSGLLTAEWRDGFIELNFPAKAAEPVEPPEGLLESLGLSSAVFVGLNKFDYLVEVAEEAIVRQLTPNFEQLKTLPVRGVMVTARSTTPGYDFVSRFFAPRVGVNEDPVTGSAHCCLTPYWNNKMGRTTFTAYQASRRGGILFVRLEGERVILAGKAVTVLKGDLV